MDFSVKSRSWFAISNKLILAPVRREEVTEWAEQEAEWTGGLSRPVEQPSWKHGYVIYLKMFYEIHEKWEQASDPEKLQQLYGQLNKYVFLETIAFMGITNLLSTNVKILAPDRYQQLIIRNVYFLWTCDATWVWAGTVLKQFGCNLLTRFTKSLLSFRLLHT